MKTTAFLGVFLSWPAWTKIPPSATLDLQLVTTPKDHEVCKIYVSTLYRESLSSGAEVETGGFLGFTDQSSKIGKFLVNKGRLKKKKKQ